MGPFGGALYFNSFKFIGVIGDFTDDGIHILARPRVDDQILRAADPQFFEKLRRIMNTVEELYEQED